MRIPAELKGLTIEVSTDGRLLRCDPNWTAEAVLNLLKNCVEHTPEGGRVRVNTVVNPLYTQITVRDTGPGFGAADLPHLFTRFYRGENAAEGGVGIGLAMAHSIAHSQGGTLKAENAPGGGALFTLRIPRTAAGV
ncbi:MAG: sensor histidine kinase, partial [Clostridia bacterium]|nr:sensor histidine kinase [Clostridia bacterium]